jgi:hypothetical protein
MCGSGGDGAVIDIQEEEVERLSAAHQLTPGGRDAWQGKLNLHRSDTPLRSEGGGSGSGSGGRNRLVGWDHPQGQSMAQGVNGFSRSFRSEGIDAPQMSCRADKSPFDNAAVLRRRKAWEYGARAGKAAKGTAKRSIS